MTSTPPGDFTPRSTAPIPSTTSTPIGDELAQDSVLPPAVTSFEPEPEPPSTSATDTAKDTASSATDHASDVAGTAADEASKVAGEAKDKATDLLADLKSQIGDQSSTQLQGLAAKLAELADQIQDLASGSESSGPVVDVAQQLADRTHELSSHLSGKEPLDLLEDVRDFARRRPTTFLAGAAVAGVVAGRLTRGAKASTDVQTSASATAPSDQPTVPAVSADVEGRS